KDLDVLKRYYEWLQLHRSNPSTYYYIETLARKHLSDNERYLSDLAGSTVGNEDIYAEYLEKLLSSPYNTVKAHAVYQLCIVRYKQSMRYSESAQSEGWNSYMYGHFDTAYRYHAVKALQLFDQHKTMLDSFAFIKDQLLDLEEEILRSKCNIR